MSFWEWHAAMTGSAEDLLLESIGSEGGRVQLWARFIFYLYSVKGLRGPDRAQQVLSGVRRQLADAGVCTDFTSSKSQLLQSAKTAARRLSREEAVDSMQRRAAKLKLAAPDELVDRLYASLWEKTQWDWDGTASKATWVAIAVQEMLGTRVGSSTRQDGPRKADHSIRAEDVTLVMRGPAASGKGAGGSAGNQPERGVRGCDMRGALGSAVAVQLSVVTSKRESHTPFKRVDIIDRRSERMVASVEEWCRMSGVQRGDGLCTYYRGVGSRLAVPDPGSASQPCTRRSTTQRDVGAAIKAACVALGLPPRHFSSNSIKKANLTKAGLGGGEAEARALSGVRSPRVVEAHYDQSRSVRRAVADSPHSRLSMADVLAMVPLL